MVRDASKKAAADNTWHATPEAEARAKKLRIVALVLWAVSIAIEIGGIFGLLLNKNILEASTSVTDRGEVIADESFPTWAFATLIGLLVVMAILTVIGSQLWKKAQELDPPSSANGVSFFFKSQLGAIVPLIAFVPIIVLIFLNKDMSKQQKGWAGGVGIVLALVAVALGVNYDPPSVEKYTAEKMAVVQLLGEDKVYWAGGGEVYHVCGNVSDLSKSAVTSGTTAEAVADGKPRLTLKLESELNACGRAVPNNIDAIVDAIRQVQQGETTEQILPSPDWTGVEGAPSGKALDELQDVIDQVKDEEPAGSSS
ncbi:hypothetical protein [Nocardioides sp. LML1-1-1.1]|uniref:hypothetical protein n=1 Tax=Nocardioides sp. LML1-1-1.1 TaxID=3135248 RepID=UPI0034150D47